MKNPASILLSPRITEKGAYLGGLSCYVFVVGTRANKKEIAQAFFEVYNVRPRKVRVLPIEHKQVQTRGTNRKGISGGGKKAYIYLTQGQTIEVV